jgi:Fe-S cluster assembly ATP-binding protein
MLELKGVRIEVDDKIILNDLNFKIKPGEVVALLGPNGSGKSTLIRGIMGMSGYNVSKGQILLNGKKIHTLPIEERVKKGLGIMHQHPQKIRGVTLYQLAQFLSTDEAKILRLAGRLFLGEHLQRYINQDFSGGEMKRSELFQILLQNPEIMLLDEPESGVDMENVKLMGKMVQEYAKQKGKSVLIITHTGHILDYVKTNRGFLMLSGQLWPVKSPRQALAQIKKGGYENALE